MKFLPVAILGLIGCLAASTFGQTPPALQLKPFLKGLENPVYLTHDGTKRIFVVEQSGVIRLVIDGKVARKPYLDIVKKTTSGGECGLLSVAFHPNFKTNGLLYVNYTAKRPKLMTVIAEFHADPKADSVDPSTERTVLTIDQPWSNHNGGQNQFGPDGFLYIGMGDGGAQDDPRNNAQNGKSLLGKILRIDPTDHGPDGTKAYGVPKDNPFVGNEAFRPEIWCWGIRNAWRFSFDPLTKDMICGDIGQNIWEEVDVIVKGGNYGWRPREALHPNPNLKKPEPTPPDAIEPIVEYSHAVGRSITGGYVYRGKSFPGMVGWYLYADYSTGRIWALQQKDGKLITNVELMQSKTQPSSFGEDVDGEIYLVDYNGVIYRLAA